MHRDTVKRSFRPEIQQLHTAIEEEWDNTPQSTAWSTLCKGDVSHCMRQMLITPDTDWFNDPHPYLFLYFSKVSVILLVIYEHLNTLKNNLALMAMFSYNLHRAQPEKAQPGSSLGFFLGPCLSREFFLATVLLHLHCLLFGVLGWVSV